VVFVLDRPYIDGEHHERSSGNGFSELTGLDVHEVSPHMFGVFLNQLRALFFRLHEVFSWEDDFGHYMVVMLCLNRQRAKFGSAHVRSKDAAKQKSSQYDS
jgi:hypothetical protein